MKQIACTNVYAMTSITMKEFSQVQLEMLHEAVLYQIGGFEYLASVHKTFGSVTCARNWELLLAQAYCKRSGSGS
jgi:hypothetical protein